MTKKITLIICILICIQSLTFAQVEKIKETPAGVSERVQFEIEKTKDPALGIVPKGRLLQAYEMRRQQVEAKKAYGARAPYTWEERGPYTDVTGPSNGNSRPGNGKTSGRVRAIWPDLSDATGKTVWVGGIDGGLWKTNNIASIPASWTPIDDFFGNLAVSSICQDPGNYSILYFGTGEKSLNSDAVRGAGVWRTEDGGINWNVMPGTENFYNVSKVECDASGNLYVACNSVTNTAGLQRYNKASATWDNITPAGLSTRIADIEMSSTGTLHVSCGYYNTPTASAGYRYTANPATVTSATWTSPATTFNTQYNVMFASNGNTIYALPSNSAFEVTTIYKSTNGGANWAATGTTPTFTSGQSWYNLAIGVDPLNANNVIVGALDCYKTTNGGSTWTKISEWVGTTGNYVHADQQIISWLPNNQVLIGCDGGVFYSANGGTNITDRNEGLRIKQFFSVAIHPTSVDYFLAGAQDNGVHQLNGAGLTSSVEVTGGDGAFVHIDQNQPQYQWGSYVRNQYRRSTNSGGSWSSVNYSSTVGQFINPTDYDDAANIMYCAGDANTYIRWSNAQTGATFTPVSVTALGGNKVTALKVSPYSSNMLYLGASSGSTLPTLVKVSAANATPTVTNIMGAGMAVSGANISCINVGTNDQNMVVVFSNYGVNSVWVTSNAGSSWTSVEGNLPDMPVRWAMFYPNDNTKLIIATETGVWTTALLEGASTLWEIESTFPNVRTDMLDYRASDGLLAAATHGRGIFTTTLTADAACGTVTGLAASSITETSANISWAALTGALSYTVEYKLNTDGTWITAAAATTALSQSLSGLTAGSLYDYRVRANCNGATGSYMAAQFTTTAAAICNVPAGLTTTNITSSGATIAWTAISGASGYAVDYKLASSGTWISAATSTTSTSLALTGLTSSSAYDWRVRTNCASIGLNSAYVQSSFTTAASASVCPGPVDVSTNGTVSGAATVPFETDVKGTLSNSTDVDYYKLVITTGGTATITLSTLPADYNLILYSSNGKNQLASSTNTGTTSETISRTYNPGTYYIKVLGSNGAFNSSVCYTLRVERGTATGQDLLLPVENTTVKVFPNPVIDNVNVYILGSSEVRTLYMYDLNGKLLFRQKVTDMITTLDMHKVAAGTYIIKVANSKGEIVSTEKVIKQ